MRHRKHKLLGHPKEAHMSGINFIQNGGKRRKWVVDHPADQQEKSCLPLTNLESIACL